MIRATVVALPVAVLLACLGTASGATSIFYTDNGNFQAASHSEGGVVITGSGPLSVTSHFGLGVVGGDFSDEVDPAGDGPDEYLHFTAEGASLFHYFALPASGAGSWGLGNLDGGLIDSFTIEGFDAQGTSVGTFNYAGSGVKIWEDEFVSRLGAGPLDAVRLTASGDRYWLGAIAIPEPHGLGLLCAAAVAVTARRRRAEVVAGDASRMGVPA